MSAATTKIYEGMVRTMRFGENGDALILDALAAKPDLTPLAMYVSRHIKRYGAYLDVRYWITARRAAPDELEAALARLAGGDAYADYFDHYSEITGYLWTDEKLRVGGHDLLAELESALGKWCHLEITYHEDRRP